MLFQGQSILYATPRDHYSLHLGHPEGHLLPTAECRALFTEFQSERFPLYLQYGEEAGSRALRQLILDEYRHLVSGLELENIALMHGTSETISTFAALWSQKGRIVILEEPTYPWALRTLKLFGAEIASVPCDREGIIPSALEELLIHIDSRQQHLIYLGPNFQNPTGRCYTQQRRIDLLNIARRANLLILEDDAYRFLSFETVERLGCFLEDAHLLGCPEHVAHASSFSKILAPGIRLGWVVGHPELILTLAAARQTGASPIGCSLTEALLAKPPIFGFNGQHIKHCRKQYQRKRDTVLQALDRSELAAKGVEVVRPSGGFYIWVEWTRGILSRHALFASLDNDGILVLDGRACFAAKGEREGIRVSFSYESVERLSECAPKIGDALVNALT